MGPCLACLCWPPGGSSTHPSVPLAAENPGPLCPLGSGEIRAIRPVTGFLHGLHSQTMPLFVERRIPAVSPRKISFLRIISTTVKASCRPGPAFWRATALGCTEVLSSDDPLPPASPGPFLTPSLEAQAGLRPSLLFPLVDSWRAGTVLPLAVCAHAQQTRFGRTVSARPHQEGSLCGSTAQRRTSTVCCITAA